MRNIKTAISGNILTITVDLAAETVVSGSGKSNVIASTEGNVSVEGKEEVKMGINIYTKKS